MACRRCFSDKIIESSAFLSLGENAQILYVHLCMIADDDGFINGAARTIATIKGGRAALKKLVDSRFLLEFGDVYVVKHWRISNSLKNDRMKPLAYEDIAKRLWIKANKAYTDHQQDGFRTLYETRTGIRLESSWNPYGILTEPNLTEPNLTEPNLTEPNLTEPNLTEPNLTEPNRGAGFDELWNAYPEIKRGSRKAAMAAWEEDIRSEADRAAAMAALAKWKRSEQWANDCGRYIPYLVNWIAKGLWRNPPQDDQIGHSNGYLDDADLEAIRRTLREETDYG